LEYSPDFERYDNLAMRGGTRRLLASAAPALAQDPAAIGRVKVLTGTAFVTHQNGQRIPAQVGQLLRETDALTTGPDGQMGVTLKDETRISLGPNTEAQRNRFAYAPAEGSLALVLRVVRGLAVYVSGTIAKLSPDAVRIETPTAIVGVRGTHLAIKVDGR
jgi:hypothetical protein